MHPALAPAIILAASLAAAATWAGEYGTTNPEEMTLDRALSDVQRGKTNMMNCAIGYAFTKKGDHGAAREIFTPCANAGYTGAMNWMSALADNGLGAAENPDEAAEWSRRSAEAGDSVGMFNYGLHLMRGRGVARDEAAGRAMVDSAAAQGLPIARRLQGADYDLDEVTPDADNWKYAPAF